LKNGAIRIIDRKRNIIKLSQGVYLAPELIQEVYTENKYISEIYVHGQILKSFLVAIIIPDFFPLKEKTKEMGF
jgi:long-chain acyl-CoA synthetase